MKYPASPFLLRPLDEPTPFLRRACRLLLRSFATIAHPKALFSTACSLFSENTRVGGAPLTRLLPFPPRVSSFHSLVSLLSPLSAAFVPNAPPSPLSTVFAHAHRGVWVVAPRCARPALQAQTEMGSPCPHSDRAKILSNCL